MSRIFYLLGFIYIFSFQQLMAQADHPDRVPGEMLVWLEHEVDVQQWLLDYQGEGNRALRLEVEKKVRPFNLFLVLFEEGQTPAENALTILLEDPKVQTAQFNYQARLRNTRTPNDPEYSQQWNMDIIDGPEAWGLTTGGLTSKGDTIVIAVLDEGLNQFHPDLRPNLWKNNAEIPGNGIDDDNNGRIDDVYGWNNYSNSDDHITGQIPVDIDHGTAVSGIIAAQGNNEEGVTGVNWDAEIMMLTGVVTNMLACEAYGYIYEMRNRYNTSLGEEGAFVVATNYSLGFDNSNCLQNHAVFNDMYDSLGMVGVLNVGATANRNVDIEQVGDTPSDCPSDFLIAVTNTNRQDEKVQGAGFGANTIDLGAPGRLAFTTVYNLNGADTINYGQFTGTSAATPHVAGAIGLLYSIECAGLASNALTDPRGTAEKVKEAILEGVDPIPTLDGITVTGGRLNLLNSLEILDSKFGVPRGTLKVLDIRPNPLTRSGSITVFYQTPEVRSYEVRLFDAIGRLIHFEDTEAICAPEGITIETDNLQNGVYFISIEDNRTIHTERVIIAR